MIPRLARMFPALLRVGFAEAVAYRAEFVVWILTTTLPLVQMQLWRAVAADRPFGRFGPDEFTAYYLGALLVRMLTGCWVVWEMNHEIRTGALSMRLLRPVHPLFAYAAQHLAAIPLRAVLAAPVAVVLLVAADERVLTDLVRLVVFPLTVAGAWLLTFLVMCAVGSLGLFTAQSMKIFDVWLGAFGLFSGYLVPVELFPAWLATAAERMPFYYILGFPVEVLTGLTTGRDLLVGLAWQWAYVAVFFLGATAIWRAGLRRFEAVGA